MRQVRIRPTADCHRFLALDKRLFPDCDPPETEGRFWFSGVYKGEHVCYASYVLESEGSTAYLERAGVRFDFRGLGLQKKLIKARCNHAKQQGARIAVTYVLGWNVASLNSLISCGFKAYRPEDPWLEDSTDVVYLWKHL